MLQPTSKLSLHTFSMDTGEAETQETATATIEDGDITDNGIATVMNNWKPNIGEV